MHNDVSKLKVTTACLHVDGGREPPHLRVEYLHVPEPWVVGRVAEVERGVGAGQVAESRHGAGGGVFRVVIESHHPTGVELLHQAKIFSETIIIPQFATYTVYRLYRYRIRREIG